MSIYKGINNRSTKIKYNLLNIKHEQVSLNSSDGMLLDNPIK